MTVYLLVCVSWFWWIEIEMPVYFGYWIRYCVFCLCHCRLWYMRNYKKHYCKFSNDISFFLLSIKFKSQAFMWSFFMRLILNEYSNILISTQYDSTYCVSVTFPFMNRISTHNVILLLQTGFVNCWIKKSIVSLKIIQILHMYVHMYAYSLLTICKFYLLFWIFE